MADGAGAGAGAGGGSADDFDWLDNMTLWADRVDRLVWAYKIVVDKYGHYNRHCHKGTVPDSASKLLVYSPHGRGLFFCLSRILNQCNVTQKLERASPQKLAQSNLHRKSVSKRFLKVKNFEFEFPTIFRLHNGIFKFSNFENRFFERRIPQRTDQVP